jgi:Leucine-rich repeat (LRR) protein
LGAASADDIDDLIKVLKQKSADKETAAKKKNVTSQANAIERIEKLGGSARVDPDQPDRPIVYVHLGLSKVTDDDLELLVAFPKLRELDLNGTKITNAGLVHLKALTNLKRLVLSANIDITDTGLANLRGLTRLEWLNLCITRATDAGLVHLRDLKALEYLQLRLTNISDAGLVHLKELKALNHLELSMTGIGDAGLAHLAELTNLKELELADTKVTSAGLVHLKGLTNLRSLDLHAYHSKPSAFMLKNFPNSNCSPQIEDDGLKHLSGLKKLEHLDLEGNNVTDVGLVHLVRLPMLSTLRVEKTKVTPAGRARFERDQKGKAQPPSYK